jgi:hypothetical protein
MRPPAAPLAALLLCLLAAAPAARAQDRQQPFYTEIADVTEPGRYFFEAISEFDVLRTDARPAVRQNSAYFTISYGVFPNAEISVFFPVITVFNERTAAPRTTTGLGDVGYMFKYNFLREREGSRRPALAVSFLAEAPTGDDVAGAGYGLANYTVNGILQKSLSERTVARLNAGVGFAATTTDEGPDFRTRGVVFTGGGSIVRRFTERLSLGAELRGARSRNKELGRGLLLGQVGGNYAFTDRVTFDFGVLGGRFPAAPRLGAQLGLSVDLDTRLSERQE